MWHIMTQFGLATAVVDFTNDLWLLLAGLLGLVWLSAGIIVFMAIQHHLSQKTQSVTQARSTAADKQEAA